jgi:hypothetical protein
MSRELRETIAFLVGLLIVVYLVWGSTTQGWRIDPSLLLLIAGMIGVPLTLPIDRRRRNGTDEENHSGVPGLQGNGVAGPDNGDTGELSARP